MYRDRSYNYKNLFSPIRIVTENYKSGMCVVFDNSGYNNSLHKNYTENDEFYMNNSIAFNSFITKNKIVNSSETYTYDKSFEETLLANFPKLREKNYNISNYLAYKADEDIMILTQNLEHKNLRLPIMSPYGDCDHDFDSVKFLSKKKNSCGEKLVNFVYIFNLIFMLFYFYIFLDFNSGIL